MYCRYCGTYLEEDAIFCSNCGRKVHHRHRHSSSNQQLQGVQQSGRQPEQQQPGGQPERQQPGGQSRQPYPASQPEWQQPVEQSEHQHVHRQPDPYPEQTAPYEQPEPQPEWEAIQQPSDWQPTKPLSYQQPEQPYRQSGTPNPGTGQQPRQRRQSTGHIPPVSSSIASSGAQAAGHAMRAAGEGIRTVHRTRNTLLTIALVIFILVTAFSLYLKYFVSGPEDTVNAFFDAYNSSDINGMIECMDPTYQNAYSAMSDMAGSLVSGLTGFDVDFGQLASLTPYLAEAEGLLPDAELISVKISYSGNKLAAFLAESPVNIIGIEKVLASDATATVTFTLEGQTYTEDLPLASYGWGDWRIEAFSLAEQLAGSY